MIRRPRPRRFSVGIEVVENQRGEVIIGESFETDSTDKIIRTLHAAERLLNRATPPRLAELEAMGQGRLF